MGCAIRHKDGSACLTPLSHHLGPVEFCCEHFDRFVEGLLDINLGAKPQTHIEIVHEYNRQVERDSLFSDTDCKAK
jgi:hypothetical protein